jgi:hypothetical protein
MQAARGSLFVLKATVHPLHNTRTAPISAQPVPSTPLPEAWTHPVSPAWDPSSRTPIPEDPGLKCGCSIFNYSLWLTRLLTALPKAWLLAPELTGKKVKLRVEGTKVLPMFRLGLFEGRVASFIAANPDEQADEQGLVKVRFLPRCDTMLLPCQYLQPFRPSGIGEKVVVIRGEIVGSEHVVCKISDGEFSLADPSAPKVALSTQPKHFLAVLSRV